MVLSYLASWLPGIGSQVELEEHRREVVVSPGLCFEIKALIEEKNHAQFDSKLTSAAFQELSDEDKFQLFRVAVDEKALFMAEKLRETLSPGFIKEKFLQACESGDVNVVRNLKKSPSVKSPNSRGVNSLGLGFERACAEGRSQVARELRSQVHKDLPNSYKKGIEEAVTHNSVGVIKELQVLDHEACFYEAVNQGREELVKQLITGLDDSTLAYALVKASVRGHEKVIDLILESSNYLVRKTVGYTLKHPIKAVVTAALLSTSAYYIGLKVTLGLVGIYGGWKVAQKVQSAASSALSATRSVCSNAGSRLSGIGRIFSLVSLF